MTPERILLSEILDVLLTLDLLTSQRERVDSLIETINAILEDNE
jgi:hypothetical protein